jgi:hypothetical protein
VVVGVLLKIMYFVLAVDVDVYASALARARGRQSATTGRRAAQASKIVYLFAETSAAASPSTSINLRHHHIASPPPVCILPLLPLYPIVYMMIRCRPYHTFRGD